MTPRLRKHFPSNFLTPFDPYFDPLKVKIDPKRLFAISLPLIDQFERFFVCFLCFQCRRFDWKAYQVVQAKIWANLGQFWSPERPKLTRNVFLPYLRNPVIDFDKLFFVYDVFKYGQSIQKHSRSFWPIFRPFWVKFRPSAGPDNIFFDISLTVRRILTNFFLLVIFWRMGNRFKSTPERLGLHLGLFGPFQANFKPSESLKVYLAISWRPMDR